ncbi:MAG TPA: hypothetical protein VKQ70_04940 [Caulobacteraceae bacterium]|jgi:hypothetical protein|nr:hypothetical protein [Caulobacteraceae bacterium]
MTDHPESEPAPPRPEPEPELTTASLARAAPASDKPAPGDAERRSFAPAGTPGADAAPLFASDEAQGLRDRWDAIQAGFVDEPRQAVEQADSLVATAMKRLAEIFADERAGLEGQWDRGDDVSTEDLRLALQRYRSFFGRLLAI